MPQKQALFFVKRISPFESLPWWRKTNLKKELLTNRWRVLILRIKLLFYLKLLLFIIIFLWGQQLTFFIKDKRAKFNFLKNKPEIKGNQVKNSSSPCSTHRAAPHDGLWRKDLNLNEYWATIMMSQAKGMHIQFAWYHK